MSLQVGGTSARAVHELRLRRKRLSRGSNQLLGASLLSAEEDRREVRTRDVAKCECAINAFKDGGLAPTHVIVNRVLETDSAVPISWAVQPGKHLKLDLVFTASLGHHVRFQRVEESLQDRPHYREEGGNLIGDGILLALNPYLHVGECISRCAPRRTETATQLVG